MTLRHLKVFIAVYQEKSVTRAAELLHMTQPTVTRAVQEIEQYYGIHLFERLKHRLYVTESGRQFYIHALELVNSFDTMEMEFRNWDEFGILRVGASIRLGNLLLPKVIADFQNQHPDLRIKVTVSNGEQLKESLLNNQLDLAMIDGSIAEEHLHKEKFAEDRLVLILPPDDPICYVDTLSLNDLRRSRFLLRENGSVCRSYLNHVFAVHGLPLEPAWESTSTQAIIQAVSAGLGISFLPEQLVKKDIREGTVATREIVDESFVRENYFVWHKSKFLAKSARELMKICRSVAEEIAH
mgnify:CR=1 FL=1